MNVKGSQYKYDDAGIVCGMLQWENTTVTMQTTKDVFDIKTNDTAELLQHKICAYRMESTKQVRLAAQELKKHKTKEAFHVSSTGDTRH